MLEMSSFTSSSLTAAPGQTKLAIFIRLSWAIFEIAERSLLRTSMNSVCFACGMAPIMVMVMMAIMIMSMIIKMKTEMVMMAMKTKNTTTDCG